MNKLTESQRAFLRTMKDSSELEQHGFRLLLQRRNFPSFFPVLAAEGFFAPERNPRPQKSDDVVAVPHWPPLDYLSRCAERASQDDDIELAERVMTVVRDVSESDDGALQNNSHTADGFAEIIGLLPNSVVHLRDLRLLPRWLRIPFATGRIAHVLDTGALSSFLGTDIREDWLKALEILRHCTVFRWEEPDTPRAAVPVVDVYSLERLIARHAYTFGRKLGASALEVFEERVSQVFSREERKNRSDIIRPAIEDHEQNRGSMPLENCLVSGIRDALLAWCATEILDATRYVQCLLASNTQILRRVGIYVLNQRWDDLSNVYPSALESQLFDPGHLHELYALLHRRFGSLPEALKVRTLKAIRSLPGPRDEDLVGSRELLQLRWLGALREAGYEPADEFHRTLAKKTNASEVEHPDFRIYTEVRWGPGRAPYDIADLVGFAQSGVIAQRLNDFERTDPLGSSPEDLVAALERAVAEAPPLFLEALPQLLEARVDYQCATLHAFRHLWDQSDQSADRFSWRSAWPPILAFVNALLTKPGFCRQINESSAEIPIASAIADLLQRGTREGVRAYPDELLPQSLRLVQRLLAEVRPTLRGDEADPMFAAINTAKGRSLEVLFAYALRRCRASDRQSGSHDAVWAEIECLFDRELARCVGTNYEFSTLAGAYVATLDYMNARWVERNVNGIFSADDHAAFLAAVGGLAYSRPSRRIYRLLRDRNIVHRALDAKLRGREVREKLVERVLLAYLWEEESIDSPRVQFSFVHGIVDDLRAAASFFWMIRGDQLTTAQRGKVVDYWIACHDWASLQETPPRELFASLGHLAWALEDIDGKNLDLLLAVVPYVRAHNPYELLKELTRLLKVSPAAVGRVFKSIVDTAPPVYDYEDRMKTLIRGLSHAGERGAAIYCANGLIGLDGMTEIYRELTEPH